MHWFLWCLVGSVVLGLFVALLDLLRPTSGKPTPQPQGPTIAQRKAAAAYRSPAGYNRGVKMEDKQ